MSVTIVYMQDERVGVLLPDGKWWPLVKGHGLWAIGRGPCKNDNLGYVRMM